MPRIGYVDVPINLKDRQRKLVAPVTKTVNSSVRFNGKLIPKRKRGFYQMKSYLPTISALWAELTDEQKELWRVAGIAQGYNPWNMFVQDTSDRINAGVSGVATPSELHCGRVARLTIEAPGTAAKFVQDHPVKYSKLRKVRGTKGQYRPYGVTEHLVLPLEVGCSYRSNFTAVGASPTIRLYAQVTYSKKGGDQINETGIYIPLVSEWSRATEVLSSVAGRARCYTLCIELVDVVGTLEVDLFRAFHTGTNFARDFRCRDVTARFANANYQLQAPWALVGESTGVTFESVYPNDGGL